MGGGSGRQFRQKEGSPALLILLANPSGRSSGRSLGEMAATCEGEIPVLGPTAEFANSITSGETGPIRSGCGHEIPGKRGEHLARTAQITKSAEEPQSDRNRQPVRTRGKRSPPDAFQVPPS